MRVKATDALAMRLRAHGVEDFFAVTGGAAVHIVDSLVNAGGMSPTFHHHEQAAALAADAYGRLRGLGVCVVTTGPGVTNAITGALCAWQDSVPCLFISGQARMTNTSRGRRLRQVGTQHLEVLPLVRSITKRAVLYDGGLDLIATLDDLVECATSGRPGPVWLDFPLDLQLRLEEVPDDVMDPPRSSTAVPRPSPERASDVEFGQIAAALMASKRPVLLLGRGSRGVSAERLDALISGFGVAVLRTWGGIGTKLLDTSRDFGRVGGYGQRGANLILGSSDLVLCLGVRLGQAVTGPDLGAFAADARMIVVDVDAEELDYVSSRRVVEAIEADAADFVRGLLEASPGNAAVPRDAWYAYCGSADAWNAEQALDAHEATGVDQYELMRELDALLGANHIVVVDGGGTVVYTSMQSLGGKSYEIVIPSAAAPMGTGLPHAVGAARAAPRKCVVVLCGDGSLPFNVQELQTLVAHSLNVKVIVINNSGYLSIRGTQDQFLDGRHLGSDAMGGLTLPDIAAVAACYGLPHARIDESSDLGTHLSQFMKAPSPSICEVVIRSDQEILPRPAFQRLPDGTSRARPLTEMDPPREGLPAL